MLRRVSFALVLLALPLACDSRDATGTGPCMFSDYQFRSSWLPDDDLDLLFVIDNSEGMARAQADLARQLPRFLDVITSGRSPQGTRFDPLWRIRIGVISADLGSGGFEHPSCAEPNFGDDGILIRDRCEVNAPPFLQFRAGESDAELFTEQAQCLATLGEDGCRFQQPLDAALKALSSASSELLFVNGSRGHVDGANEGFHRYDPMLSVVFLTSGDDCSAANPDVFNEASTTYTHPEMSQRCVRHSEALQSVERYVDGFRQIISPERLFVTIIAGIPPDLLPSAGQRPDYERLLNDERMEPGPDPSDPSQLRTSCQGPDRQRAHAPRRLIEVSQALEADYVDVTLGSVCSERDSALDELAEGIAARRRFPPCFNQALPKDRAGRARCNLTEVMPLGATCEEQSLSGVAAGVDYEGRAMCQVCQLDAEGRVIDLHPTCAGATSGWYYDDVNAVRGCERRPHRVVFVGGEISEGALVRFECLTPSITAGGVGESCRESSDCSESELSLECSETSRTCQLSCADSAECEAAGLAGFLCTSVGASSYCTHPSCPGG
ncbi:MAG: hypothetical protein AB8H86_31325 [Polyangiales bacterium]